MTSNLPQLDFSLLAAGLNGDLLFYAVILLVTVLGGILQKKKAGEAESAGKRRPGPRDRRQGGPPPPLRVEPPVRTLPPADSTPARARPVEPTPPPRGPGPAKVTYRTHPGAPGVPPPVARRDRDIPPVPVEELDFPDRVGGRPVARPPEATGPRPSRRAAESRRRATPVARRAAPAEIEADGVEDRVELEAGRSVAGGEPEEQGLPAPSVSEAAAYGASRATAVHLRIALGSPGGLRTAVVLSEILAPPLALREQR